MLILVVVITLNILVNYQTPYFDNSSRNHFNYISKLPE